MRNVVLVLLISVIMIIAISFSIRYLNEVSQDLGKLSGEIERDIMDDNWDKAYKTTLEFTNKWEDYSRKIKLFANHQEIDNIEITISKLPQYIKERTKDESLACINVLKFLMNHISELEKVTIQNVF